MLSDFFRINLPYGIRGNNKKGWSAFNREYKPLGFNNMYSDRIKYGEYPIYTEYELLTEKKLKQLDTNESCEIQQEGDEFLIFLYNDATNPVNSTNSNNWDIYFKKLKILSKLKRKSKFGKWV